MVQGLELNMGIALRIQSAGCVFSTQSEMRYDTSGHLRD